MIPATGNDIVALDLVDPQRSRDPRFYSRIISDVERMEYAGLAFCDPVNRMPFETFVWLAWSVKESAYKYLKRAQPALIFSPRKFIIEAICGATAAGETYSGRVVCGSDILYFRTMVCKEYISTVAWTWLDTMPADWVAERIAGSTYAEQSEAVRTLLLSRLEALYPRAGWRIEKNADGCPVALDGADRRLPVSLAHHGHYVACSVAVRIT